VILRLPARLMHDWRAQAREVLEQDAVAEGVEPVPPDLVVKGSHCPSCKHALSPLDNIPLLSFVALHLAAAVVHGVILRDGIVEGLRMMDRSPLRRPGGTVVCRQQRR